MIDLNDCTVFYTKNGSRIKQRAVKKLTGELPNDLGEASGVLSINTIETSSLPKNTTNDSLYKWMMDWNKNRPLNIMSKFYLASGEKYMPDNVKLEFENIKAKIDLEFSFLDSEKVASFVLKGKFPKLMEIRIPKRSLIMIETDTMYK
jgi:hypothetical protein